jgi:hypothetical protein
MKMETPANIVGVSLSAPVGARFQRVKVYNSPWFIIKS